MIIQKKTLGSEFILVDTSTDAVLGNIRQLEGGWGWRTKERDFIFPTKAKAIEARRKLHLAGV